MSADTQNNEHTTQGVSSSTNSIPNVKFIINPIDRQETSASLVDSQDLLMSKSFPRNKDYSISLVLHPPTRTFNRQYQEWNFIKNGLITFEGMIKKKFKADGISYQEAPQIVLYFPNAVPETNLRYLERARMIRRLLKDHYENRGGLNYCLSDEAQPSEWAPECVFWGIVHKDDDLLG